VHVDCQVGLMKPRTHGREASGRTLSVTIHCLRQKQTRLLGNGGCFVSIACLLVLHSSLYTLSSLSNLHCRHSTTASPIHSLFRSLLLVACRLFYFKPAALLRLLLGVRLSAPRHSLRFAYTLSLGTAVSSWNRWSHAACIPGSF
jgi:hypothetical protein